MQIPQLGSMALLVNFVCLFIFLNVGQNQIDNEGCKWLSQSKWDYLKQLNISYNNISSEGVKNLCKSNWPLKKLFIRIFCDV